jgi:hypothetical protein
MKLITEAIWKRLPALGDTDGCEDAAVTVHAKLFTPDANCTWYITEGDRASGRLFGLCDLGLGFPEIGYVMLSEIERVRGRMRLPVERDLHWEGTLADAWQEVRR